MMWSSGAILSDTDTEALPRLALREFSLVHQARLFASKADDTRRKEIVYWA